jgi:hypothetical protein
MLFVLSPKIRKQRNKRKKTKKKTDDGTGETLQHQVNLSVEVRNPEEGGEGSMVQVRYGNAGEGEQTPDLHNTVEQVVWKDIPKDSHSVTIKVSLGGVLIPDNAVQPFALVWSVY